MSGTAGPLILSSPASRRLRLLHCAEAGNADEVAPFPGLDPSTSWTLAVADMAVLGAGVSEDAPSADPGGGPTQDPTIAVGLAVETMIRLQIPAGALVELSSVYAQDGPPGERPEHHLGHVMALGPGSAAAPDTAYMQPLLAHNLGAALDTSLLLCPSGARPNVRIARSPLDAVPAAASVSLAPVAVPASDVLTLHGERPGEEGGAPDDGADDDGADVVALLQAHFLAAPRVVARGDLLALPRARAPEPGLLLDALHGRAAVPGEEGRPRAGGAPILLRVTAVQPGPGPALFVPGTTESVLEGSARSSAPPSVLGFPRLQEGAPLAPAAAELARLLAGVAHPGSRRTPLRLAALLHGPPGAGRRSACLRAAAAAGFHALQVSAHSIRSPDIPEDKALEALRSAFTMATAFAPVLLLLRDVDALGAAGEAGGFAARAGAALAECVRRHATADHPVVLCAAAERPDALAPPLRRCFTHELEVAVPNAGGRAAELACALGGLRPGLAPEVLQHVGQHTAGLTQRELRAVAAGAAVDALADRLPVQAVLDGRTTTSAKGVGVASTTAEQPQLAGAEARGDNQSLDITREALQRAVERVRTMAASDVGAPKIPSVKWEDVGGLEDVKRAILDTVELPLKHPELFSGGLRRRSGVLLYGPPGTGKTLLAKAVATECSINFLSVKGPELVNMYVGESERQVRQVFERAKRARPCVVFFDELDSLAPARGKGSDSGGVMDRVVAQLLAEIDSAQGGSGEGDIFLIGATNRPDLLDAALLRPGRLDKLLYVGIAPEPSSKQKVLEALSRKFTMDADVDLAAVAEACPPQFTGADMYALCSDAWMTAFKQHISKLGGLPAGGNGNASAIMVRQADFLQAATTLQPSLGEDEIAKYEVLRDQYEGGAARH
ncbi:hypothetical protein ACKKBG_A23960 [Auxenochlorella protothecoides x Auxenochlorella symbiontica]